MYFLAQQEPPPDDIYDIVVLAPKDPVWPAYLGIIFMLLLLVAAGLFALWMQRKAGPRGSSFSPEQRVARRFNELESQHGTLAPNRFALAVSEALKDYLSEKFDDPLRYETAEEFLRRVAENRSKMPEAAQQSLQKFLLIADELKFGNTVGTEEKTFPLLESANQIVWLCQAIGDDSEQSR